MGHFRLHIFKAFIWLVTQSTSTCYRAILIIFNNIFVKISWDLHNEQTQMACIIFCTREIYHGINNIINDTINIMNDINNIIEQLSHELDCSLDCIISRLSITFGSSLVRYSSVNSMKWSFRPHSTIGGRRGWGGRGESKIQCYSESPKRISALKSCSSDEIYFQTKTLL